MRWGEGLCPSERSMDHVLSVDYRDMWTSGPTRSKGGSGLVEFESPVQVKSPNSTSPIGQWTSTGRDMVKVQGHGQVIGQGGRDIGQGVGT